MEFLISQMQGLVSGFIPSGLSLFSDMLQDEDRNLKYFLAIQDAVCKMKKLRNGGDVIVLDVGCGSGLLTLMALSAGADKVYACEVIPTFQSVFNKVMKDNNVDMGKVTYKVGRSTELSFPTKADILVAEVFDTDYVGEGCVATFNDAKRRLLTTDAIIIPQHGSLYAQLVDCPLIRSSGIINELSLPGTERKLRFPQSMEKCSDSTSVDIAMNLWNLPSGYFTKISPPLETFKFRWGNKEPTPEGFTAFKAGFKSLTDGEMNTIFSWWDMKVGNHPETGEDLIISCAPPWADTQNASAWRHHWEQGVFYGFAPINLSKGQQGYLECFRGFKPNALNVLGVEELWFEPTLDMLFTFPTHPITKNTMCLCHFHEIPQTYYEMQDETRLAPFLKALGEKMRSFTGGVNVHCLSDNQLFLPLAVLTLGADTVSVPELSMIETFLLQTLLEENKFPLSSVTVLGSRAYIDQCPSKVNLVIGEPFYKIRDDDYANTALLEERQEKMNAFRHLRFWKKFGEIPSKFLSSNIQLLPFGAEVRCMAVKFDKFGRQGNQIGMVCGERFNLQAFNDLTDPIFDQAWFYQLWQHPSCSSSEVVSLLDIDFATGKARRMESKANLRLNEDANAIVFWCEWKISPRKRISHGLINTPYPGETTEWCRYMHQGILFTGNIGKGKVVKIHCQYNGDDHVVLKANTR